MQFSARFSMAIHTLLFISQYSKTERVTSALLANAVGCNPVIMRKLLSQLNKAELISVTPGIGGAHLSVDPEDLSLLDIFRAVEEKETLFPMLHPEQTDQQIRQVISRQLFSIEKSMLKKMERITLQDLIDDYESNLP